MLLPYYFRRHRRVSTTTIQNYWVFSDSVYFRSTSDCIFMTLNPPTRTVSIVPISVSEPKFTTRCWSGYPNGGPLKREGRTTRRVPEQLLGHRPKRLWVRGPKEEGGVDGEDPKERSRVRKRSQDVDPPDTSQGVSGTQENDERRESSPLE